jgi:hypothetical protein
VEKISRIQRLILKDLFKARGKIDSYTLFRREYITPAQLAASISKFITDGKMEEREGELLLTPKGKRWVVQKRLFSQATDDYPWKSVPDEFRQDRLAPWFPYVPELDLLDKSLKDS